MKKFDDIINYFKEQSRKKIITILISIFLILILTIVCTKNVSNRIKEKKLENENPNTIFSDSNNKISIELEKKYNLTQYTSSDYLIELRSSDNLDIFISQKPLIENYDLSKVISSDKSTFINEFKYYSNLSNEKALLYKNYPAYTYSFQYLDNKNKIPYYLQVIWIQAENCYYVMDIEFPVDTISTNSNIVMETISTFKF